MSHQFQTVWMKKTKSQNKDPLEPSLESSHQGTIRYIEPSRGGQTRLITNGDGTLGHITSFLLSLRLERMGLVPRWLAHGIPPLSPI